MDWEVVLGSVGLNDAKELMRVSITKRSAMKWSMDESARVLMSYLVC